MIREEKIYLRTWEVKELQMKYYTQQILHLCFKTVNPSRFQWIENIF